MLFMAMTKIGNPGRIAACESHGLLAIPIIALCLAAVRLEWIDPALLGGSARQQRFSGYRQPQCRGSHLCHDLAAGHGGDNGAVPQLAGAPHGSQSLLTLAFGGATWGSACWRSRRNRARRRCCFALPRCSLCLFGMATTNIAVPSGRSSSVGPYGPARDSGFRSPARAGGRWRQPPGVWQRFWLIAWEAPWAGYGLGSFIEVNQLHLTTNSALTMWDFGAAHAAPSTGDRIGMAGADPDDVLAWWPGA
jgi:hypothetical protein